MDKAKNWRTMTFGTRVRELRKLRGLGSQTALAKLAGIEQPSLSVIESGETKLKNIKDPTMAGLIKGLRVSRAFLIEGKGSPDDELEVSGDDAASSQTEVPSPEVTNPYRDRWREDLRRDALHAAREGAREGAKEAIQKAAKELYETQIKIREEREKKQGKGKRK